MVQLATMALRHFWALPNIEKCFYKKHTHTKKKLSSAVPLGMCGWIQLVAVVTFARELEPVRSGVSFTGILDGNNV